MKKIYFCLGLLGMYLLSSAIVVAAPPFNSKAFKAVPACVENKCKEGQVPVIAGPQGPQGARGPAGPQGPAGSTGTPGDVIYTATTQTAGLCNFANTRRPYCSPASNTLLIRPLCRGDDNTVGRIRLYATNWLTGQQDEVILCENNGTIEQGYTIPSIDRPDSNRPTNGTPIPCDLTVMLFCIDEGGTALGN